MTAPKQEDHDLSHCPSHGKPGASAWCCRCRACISNFIVARGRKEES